MKIKKFVLTALCVVFTVFMSAAIFAACDGGSGNTVKVLATCDGEGVITFDNGTGRYAPGSEVTVNVKANNGYEIEKVTLDDEDITESVLTGGGSYKFTIEKNCVVTAKFAVSSGKTYKATVAAYDTSKGTVTLDKADGNYASGSEVTVTIEPAIGYEIEKVSIDKTDVTSKVLISDGKGLYDHGGRTYKFYIGQNRTITVSFWEEDTRYNRTMSWTLEVDTVDPACGTLDYSPKKATYYNNDEITVTATLVDNARVQASCLNLGAVRGTDGEIDFSKGTDYAKELTTNRTITKTFRITENCMIAAFFDNLDDITFVTKDNYLTAVQNGNVILDFTQPATKCTACGYLDPYLEEFVTVGYDVAIVQFMCDLSIKDNLTWLAQNVEVVGTPTMLLFHDGKEVVNYKCGTCGTLIAGTEKPTKCTKDGCNGKSFTVTSALTEETYRSRGWYTSSVSDSLQWEDLCNFAQVDPSRRNK